MWWREWDSACLSGSDTISVLVLSAAEAAVVQGAAAVAGAAAAAVTAEAAGAAADPHPEAEDAAVAAGHPGAGDLIINDAHSLCVIYCVKKPCRTDAFHLL